MSDTDKTEEKAPCAHPEGEKCVDCAIPYYFATSFAELDKQRDAADTRNAVEDVIRDFRTVTDSIMVSELTATQKASALATATSEMATRVENPPKRKGVGDRIKALFAGRDALPGTETGAQLGTFLTDRVDPGAFRVFKDHDGEYRWLAIYSNNLWDRDDEVIPASEHADFIAKSDAESEYPELWLWHTPGTKAGKADVMDLSTEGFAIASGVFDTDKAETAQRLATRDDLGVSHGFSYESKTESGAILGYRTFEISPLPIGRAANSFTGFRIGDKEEEVQAMSLTPEKREFLVATMGESEVAALEASLGKAKAAAEADGVGFKEVLDALLPAGDGDGQKDDGDAQEGEGEGSGEPTPATLDLGGLTEALQPVIDSIGALASTQAEQGKAIAELQGVKSSDDAVADPKPLSLQDQIAAAMHPKGKDLYLASGASDNLAHGNSAEHKAVSKGLTGEGPEYMTPQMELLRLASRNNQPVAQVQDGDVGDSGANEGAV